MSSILVIHGPNLNLLGERETSIYGDLTLDDINRQLTELAEQENAALDAFQSNAEHELIERIHQARRSGCDFIIINAGAYTHTSVALRDALLGSEIPFIECHISNVYKREAFRHHSYLADIAVGVITGLGVFSYKAALMAALDRVA